MGLDFRTPLTSARAAGLRARANGDGKALLDAAERHLELGFMRGAKEFADLAAAALGRSKSTARSRAQLIAKEMVTRLHESTPGSAPVVPLTRRELEVASLAAKGMADRDIATVLHVSVRTVESHVAATYRKLDISIPQWTSRRPHRSRHLRLIARRSVAAAVRRQFTNR